MIDIITEEEGKKIIIIIIILIFLSLQLEPVSDGFNSLCYVLGADGEDSDG